ncbi:MAG: aminotransferase class V-fold PLP-dependent enzyme [Firmicutes bacterium]|nr:aminotransferase class V-fold PLP-dependent enzyme [Bacillota bacterium]
MIYLDNSASSFFKPPAVIKAMANTLKFLPFNPSRAGHSGALKAGLLLYRTRTNLADYFGGSAERVIFTGGCTEALNLAILGGIKAGGHVITTPFEHNSVLRPLYHLGKTANVRVTLVTNPSSAASAIRPETSMIIINHVSNVTGQTADLMGFASVAEEKNIPLLVDAAQSAGHIEINMKGLGMSMLAIAPHKGLHAAQGVGALLVDEKITLRPLKFGGTGTASSSPIQPDEFPEGFESGTLPLPAIAALNAGLNYTREIFDANNKKILGLCARLIERLGEIRGVTLYSKPNVCGIVAFNIYGYASQEAGDVLSQQYDVAVRCGMHCAPLLHDFYGSKEGMIRASVGCDNTLSEIDFFVGAIREMAGITQ